MPCLRPEFEDKSKVHIDKDVSTLSGFHENELFYNCTFNKLNGLTLKDCVLNESQFLTDNVQDCLNFCITLNCFSFNNVTLSPLIFDLILTLLISGKGNTEKRRKLIDVIGRDRFAEINNILKVIE